MDLHVSFPRLSSSRPPRDRGQRMGGRSAGRERDEIPQALMVALGMIVLDELADGARPGAFEHAARSGDVAALFVQVFDSPVLSADGLLHSLLTGSPRAAPVVARVWPGIATSVTRNRRRFRRKRTP